MDFDMYRAIHPASFKGQMLNWVDPALENLILISSRHSSAEAHARLRHIRRWRRAASRQELMALVSKARVDDDEPANPVMRHEYVEHLLMSAAVVILASEELSTRCMSEMGELQRVAASWEWFSLQPKRVAVVARFIRGKTIHQMYLQCDQERDEAKSQRATLARTLARLRRALAFWENVKSLSSLQTALSRHLDLLDSILQPESLDELYERVIELHPVGPSPLPYDTCPSPVAAHSRPLSSIQATALANATAQQLFGHTRPPALGAATPADPSAPSVEGRGGSCLPPFSASSFSALQPGVDVMRLRNTLERMRVLSMQLPSTMALISSTSQQVTTPPLFFKMWPMAFLGGASSLSLLLRPGRVVREVCSLVSSMKAALLTIIKDHLEEPSREIYKELFLQQHKAGLSQWTLQAEISRESLERMIETFRSKVGNVPVMAKGEATPEAIANLDLVMRIYEEQVKSPVSSMLFGDMLQALLIQMQSLKVNMEEEAAAVHALMKANQLSLQMMAAVPALLAGFVAVVVVRRFFSYIRREPTHPRRRFTQLVREAERLLLEDLDDVDVGKGDGGGGADQLLTEEHLGCLCYLVQVMDKTVGAMHLSSDAKKLIRLDLAQVVRIKTSVDQRLSLLHSLLRDIPSLA